MSGDPAGAEPDNRRAGTRTAEPATAPSVIARIAAPSHSRSRYVIGAGLGRGAHRRRSARFSNVGSRGLWRRITGIGGLHLTGVDWPGDQAPWLLPLPPVGGPVPGVVPHRCRLSWLPGVGAMATGV